MKFNSILSAVATCLFALSVPAVDWFDAGIGSYTQWPPAQTDVRGGVWTNESSSVSLSSLAMLSGAAPQATLNVEATDGTLDFCPTSLDLDEQAKGVTVSLGITFTACSPRKLPAVNPQAKAGVILVNDGQASRLYYLAKDAGGTNVWTASDFVVADETVKQDVTVTLRKLNGVLCATYAVGGTAVASDVEVYAAEAKLSKVSFEGHGKLAELSGTAERNAFRVTPYVQHPSPTAMSLLWLAQGAGDARVEVWKDGSSEVRTLTAVAREDLAADVTGGRFTDDNVLQYCVAPELSYTNSVENGDNYPAYTREGKSAGWSMPYTVPYQYRVRLTGLEADTLYRYRVTLDGDGAVYENKFRTAPDPSAWRGFKFIYFSDSETEPADNPDSTGRTTDWSEPGSTDATHDRTYFATQTECYASNLCAAVDFGTDLIVMAGDLAQKGSRQCDWDEFWRHNAGQLNDPAGSIPILASPGNHDYYSYVDGGTVATRKYLSYFEYEKNGAAVDPDQQERFHRVDYGPVTFIFLDANNGDDSKTDPTHDTNHYISREASGRHDNGANSGIGCRAPDFNPGSVQYQWLEAQLKDAQKKSAFTFIVTHQCPFSAGYHGRPVEQDGERLSGQPLRVLLPLMHKYGVDGWLAGHDEMMERAVTEGTETLPSGEEVPHSFFVWDMGIAGDGLRGCRLYDGNTNERYRADVDCPEVYKDGILVDGGKHYGHLEVTIDQTEDGRWRATFDPVYVFFNNDENGKSVYGGVRHYDDKQVRISNRNAGAGKSGLLLYFR